MDESLCLDLSNPQATGFRENLASVSSGGSDSSPRDNTNYSVVSRSRFPSVRSQLLKTRKITCESVLPLSVAVAALFAVWGAVTALNVFWALPASLQNGQNKSDEVNNSSTIGVRNITQVDLGNNKTCHRLLRSDPLTNSCYIPCAEWDWRTESEKQLDLAATYTTMVISIVCVIIAIITWIKLKRLWSFPLIIPLYVLLVFSSHALSRYILQAFTKEAFCSDKDFLRSVHNPTSFCLATGAIRHYLLCAGYLWLVLCYGNLWWIVVFPTKGKLLFENRRRIHIIQSIVAWSVPIIPVVAVFSVNGRYSQGLTFPYVCVPSSPALFYYTTLLPLQLLIASCCTLLIWTCYSLAKQTRIRSSLTADRFSVGCQKTANGGSLYIIKRRLTVLFVSYAIVMLFVLVCYGIVVRNHHVILVAFKQYLSCALSTPQSDCIQLFRKHTVSQMMVAANFAGYNLATIGPTIFFFAYKEVRNLWFSVITCGLYSRKKNSPSGKCCSIQPELQE